VTRHQTPPLRRPLFDERDERERRGKRALKPTIEKLGGDCLDVGTLRRFGLFGDKRNSWSAFRWPDITKIRADRYSLELEMPRKVSQQIRVSWTRCHFGWGLRPWLHCPFCQRRVAKLFNGFAGYCCRVCVGNPPYASQTKSAQSRRHFEACKLRLRLGGNASLDAPFPERPKGMHRRTYARLKHRAEQLEAQISSLLRAKAPDYPNLVYYFDR
jgi:hypothetical protein